MACVGVRSLPAAVRPTCSSGSIRVVDTLSISGYRHGLCLAQASARQSSSAAAAMVHSAAGSTLILSSVSFMLGCLLMNFVVDHRTLW